MSDHMIPVEKVQELIDAYWEYEKDCMNGVSAGKTREVREVSRGRAGLYRTVIADLEKLLPRKTLADLPPDERADCQWMEAHDTEGTHFVIARVMNYSVTALWANGLVTSIPHGGVTPLPDKPKVQLPWNSDPF